MALFGKEGKDRKDVVEMLGGEPAPSYDERLERSSRRMNERLDGLGQERRNKLYIRLTAAIGVLFVAAVAAGALYTCSAADGTSRVAAQTSGQGSSAQAQAGGSAAGEPSAGGEGGAVDASETRKRFNGLVKLTWMTQSDVDGLCSQLIEWADEQGYPDGYSVCILTMSDSASTAKLYAEVLPSQDYLSCERAGDRWEFGKLDGKPDELAADQEKSVAASKSTSTNNVKVPVSDAAYMSKFIPDAAAEGLSESLGGYCSAKGWGFDADKSRLVCGSIKTTSNQSAFGVTVSDGGQERYLTVTYDISKKTYSYTTQH